MSKMLALLSSVVAVIIISGCVGSQPLINIPKLDKNCVDYQTPEGAKHGYVMESPEPIISLYIPEGMECGSPYISIDGKDLIYPDIICLDIDCPTGTIIKIIKSGLYSFEYEQSLVGYEDHELKVCLMCSDGRNNLYPCTTTTIESCQLSDHIQVIE